MLDQTATDESCVNLNSPPARLTAGDRNSFRGTQFASNLEDLTASPQSLSHETSSRPATSSPQNYPSTAYLSPPTAQPTYLPTPVSQPYSPFPVLSPGVLNTEWPQSDQARIPTPSLRLHPSEDTSRPRQPERTTTMSAVAIPFDPAFSLGPRSAFTWPGPLDSQQSPAHNMLGHDLSSMGPGSDPSLTPPSGARSLTSSPPRGSLTPQQRELKRQQDRARRDSRLTTRLRRTSSHSYVQSPPPSAMSLPDASSAMSLPVYTTASAPISLLTEPATTMATSPYLQSYSPPMEEQTHASQVYPASYSQNMQPNYSMPMDYPTIYAGQNHYSSRATTASLPVGQDVGLMYQVPAVMATGGATSGAGAHEGGHVRVVQSRPKPRCWEHGCNGRQFSTFSNLLRHQREKSGQAAKASCPNCGAEFTRTTARNGHLLHDKCKGRRNTMK